jgi:hypothetical protein
MPFPISAIIRQPAFDTEVFIDLIQTIAAALTESSPQRRARDALAIIYRGPTEGGRSPVVDLWEAMPATSRVSVEALTKQAKPFHLTHGGDLENVEIERWSCL